jgi:phosphoenolpyruvate carboxylase
MVMLLNLNKRYMNQVQGQKHKQAKKKATQAAIISLVVSAHPTQKSDKSVAAMFCKTPEVVANKHKNKTTQ